MWASGAIFLGYTSCPDVCPMTLDEMPKIENQLGNLPNGLAVAMITIDPKRDTVERLAKYIPVQIIVANMYVCCEMAAYNIVLIHARGSSTTEWGFPAGPHKV